ncbi:hypothetical protein C8F04DRAFT_1239359 [Mycena alexandri]|uniref:F-box domain-containing protein n=1 Tax=Mycena alexandri TaxID=1745969 RepID=A0AAD6SCR7_9AGAR|nr:hypothetical protein C8F04DRAFT_1239359 [Mycena alexandri]
MSTLLPNELWLEVLHNLPPEGLSNIASTHRNLHALIRPLIFKKFTYYPYNFWHHQQHGRIIHHPPPAQAAHILEQLEFWASDEIAPLVRACEVVSSGEWRHTAGEHGTVEYLDLDENLGENPDSPAGYALLDAFFLHLGRFTGLRTLHTHTADVRFSALAINALCLLPVLDDLRIQAYNIAADTPANPSLRLSVSRLALVQTLWSHTQNAVWLRILDRECLRELVVTGRDLEAEVSSILEGMPFPNVHSLKLSLANTPSKSQTSAILSQLPSIRELALLGAEPEIPNIPTAALDFTWGVDGSDHGGDMRLPALTHYSGPLVTVPTFISTLTKLAITAPACKPDDVIRVLRGTWRRPTNISSLTLELDLARDGEVMYAGLEVLGSFLEGVEELKVTVCLSNKHHWDYEELNQVPSANNFKFFRDLARDPTAFPASLRRLAISWRLPVNGVFSKYHYKARDRSDTDINLVDLRESLLGQCVGLSALWIDGYDFGLSWFRPRDGAAREWIGVERDEVIVTRKLDLGTFVG